MSDLTDFLNQPVSVWWTVFAGVFGPVAGLWIGNRILSVEKIAARQQRREEGSR